jgi:hypothetical protein
MNAAALEPSAIDITPIVKARRRCGATAMAGYLVASLGMLFAFAIPTMWIVVASLLAASVALASGSRIGAIAHLILTSACLWYLGYDWYRFQTVIAPYSKVLGRPEPTIPWGWIGLCAVAFAAAVAGVQAAVTYHRLMPAGPGAITLAGNLARRLQRQLRSPGDAGARRAAGIYVLVALLLAFAIVASLMVTGVCGEWWVDALTASGRLVWMWIAAYAILAGPLATAVWFLLTKAKRLRALNSAQWRAIDRRSHILLLRSFQDDLTPIQRRLPFTTWQPSDLYSRSWTLEEALEREISACGPVVAVGRPGEALRPAGAAREYLRDDEWKERVADLITRARFIVMVAGKTEGVTYEYAAIREFAALDKLMLVFPPLGADETRERWTRFCGIVDSSWAQSLPDAPGAVLMTVFPKGTSPVFLTCTYRDQEDCYQLALRRTLPLLDASRCPA